jgi:hypothetical protein
MKSTERRIPTFPKALLFFCGFLYFRGFGGILFVMSSSDDQTHEASGGLFGGLYMCVFGLS